MWWKRRTVKIGAIVLVTLLILGGGLVALSHYKVIAISLPFFEDSSLGSEPEEEYAPNQIIVKFKPGTSSEDQDHLNQSLGTSVIYTSPAAGFKVLQIPEGKTVAEMVALYSEQSIVEYAEPNYVDYTLPESK
jgi:hypothetical protein